MKTVYGLLVLVFVIFGTCVLAAPPTFGPPGIAPDPGGELPTANTIPNIEGGWIGEGRDVHKHDVGFAEPGGPYEVQLSVWLQEGPRFVGNLAASGITSKYMKIAGYITDGGEINMFGGVEGISPTGNTESCHLMIKAKLYKEPERSIRGCWQAFCWGGDGVNAYKVNSGSFVLSPWESNNDEQ